jgi:hypothetical protein
MFNRLRLPRLGLALAYSLSMMIWGSFKAINVSSNMNRLGPLQLMIEKHALFKFFSLPPTAKRTMLSSSEIAFQ